MNRKTLFVSILMLLVFVMSACAPAGGAAAPVRTMSVTGMGQVSLKPDLAYINIGVHTEAATASAASADNSSKTEKLLAALKAAGIAENDLRTTNFSIYANAKYGPDGQPTGETVYMVDNTVNVTVRDLAKLGDILDKSVDAGANNINSIQFDVADKTAALSQARKSAVEAARKQAEELASAAGVTLGSIQNISYYDTTPGPVYDMAKGMGGGGAEALAAVPVNPGTLQLTVNVTLSYEIK